MRRGREKYCPSGLGLVASSRRAIRPGHEYDKYFSKPLKKDPYLTYLGTTHETLEFMTRIVGDTANETQKLAKKLKGETLERTIHNIWNFLYHHFQYKQDSPTTEELRSPSRSWSDRVGGIDCDCFSILAGSLLQNISLLYPGHIPGFAFRMTKYNGRNFFQHVYVVVPKKPGLSLEKRGNYHVIDPVLDKPDYEKPFSEKFDKMMPIRFLNGVDDELDLSGLDGKKKKKGKTKVGKFIKKAAKVVKKVTVGPAAIPIRNGLLLAMKLNFKRMAERLGYGYFTPEEAQAKGLDMNEYQKVKKALNKTIKIFKAMEGKEANLKKAILAGWKKGSKKRPLKAQPVNGIFDFPNVLTTLVDFASTPQDNMFTSEEKRILFPALGFLNGIAEELGDAEESLGRLKIKKPSLKRIIKVAAAPALLPAAVVSKKARQAVKEHVKVVATAAAAPVVAPALVTNKKARKKLLGKKRKPAQAPAQPSGQAVAQVLTKNKSRKAARQEKRAARKKEKSKKGILSALKKNPKNVSKKLAPGFMTPQQAEKAGLDPEEHSKLVAAKEEVYSKIEPHGVSHEEFKEAVDSGADADDQMFDEQMDSQEVASEESEDSSYDADADVEQVEDYTDAEEVDGDEVEAINGLLGLGEPATAAGVTAASGVIAAVLAALSGVDYNKLLGKKGGEFPSKEEREMSTEDLQAYGGRSGGGAPIIPGIPNNTLLIGAALIGGYYLLNQKDDAPQYVAAPAQPVPPQPQALQPLNGAKSKSQYKTVRTIKI